MAIFHETGERVGPKLASTTETGFMCGTAMNKEKWLVGNAPPLLIAPIHERERERGGGVP